MDLQLEGKVIVVSGGAKGIGAGIVKQLAMEKAVPVIIGRSESDNLEYINELRKENLIAHHVVAELTEPAECEKAIGTIAANFGKIEGLVNNAGVNDGVGLEKGDYDSFMKSLHRNVVHYYLLAHYALPHLKKNKRPDSEYYFQDGGDGPGWNIGLCGSQWGKKCIDT